MNELNSKSAIILLGHGSRVPEAGKHMEQVAIGCGGKGMKNLALTSSMNTAYNML
ncbi:MAG: hypothetical protein HQK59_14380 [Deltaproteobacteria bacterium]|nr:hypothetical protein [Deltaproteobacteria bacterium]MBF0526251.1 hypothetical protein [Deltaproteobacteria bacterium]